MPMISYRCPDCGSDDEQFHHQRANAPSGVACRGTRVIERPKEKIEHQIKNADGTVTIEIEAVEVAPKLEPCGGTALQRESMPGELWARPARGFEAMVIYERMNYDALPADTKRSLNRFYIPGRNNEPTEPGMRRIEITNIAEYNRVSKEINAYETQKMRDHRAMHEYYWSQRRKALRDDVNARIRSNPTLMALTRMVRARSDRKSAVRYGKSLDAHFHAQLIEFNQGKIQDWCAEDTGWKSRRAR